MIVKRRVKSQVRSITLHCWPYLYCLDAKGISWAEMGAKKNRTASRLRSDK